MRSERASIGWQFWLQWLGATSVSWVVGAILYYTLNLVVLGGVGEVVGGTIWGLVVGIGQWLVLRRWLDRAGWWVLATAAGSLLAASVDVGLQGLLGEKAGGLILMIGLGPGVGVLQWLFLRQQVTRAGWWLLASTVLIGGAFLTGIVASLSLGLQESGLAFIAVAGVVSGVLLGITSGLTLAWLLRRPGAAPVRVRAEAS